MYDINGFRQYCNAPETESDGKLMPFLEMAVAEADAAGVPRFENNALYDEYIYALATYKHDNRGLTGTFAEAKPETLEAIKASYTLKLRHAKDEVAT